MTSSPEDTIAVTEVDYCKFMAPQTWLMSEKWMKMLLSKGKLLELKSINFDMCESCILGKQKMVNLSKY